MFKHDKLFSTLVVGVASAIVLETLKSSLENEWYVSLNHEHTHAEDFTRSAFPPYTIVATTSGSNLTVSSS